MPNARLTVGDRITRSKVPVTGSLDPRENPPLWAVGVIGAVLASTADLPDWARVVLVVAALAAGAAVQWFTVSAANVKDSGGPATRNPDTGALGQRDEA